MKLSKTQKLEAYTYCLLMALTEDSELMYTGPNLEYCRGRFFMGEKRLPALGDVFPELIALKERTGLITMFANNADRISAIERAIELTEKLKA